jgi:hypothetical protein
MIHHGPSLNEEPFAKRRSKAALLQRRSAFGNVFRGRGGHEGEDSADPAGGLLLMSLFVTDSQLFTASFTAFCKDLAAIWSRHTGTETVFVPSFPSAGLKCPFHRIGYVYASFKGGQS